MPELPEVETVCRGLKKELLFSELLSVAVFVDKLRDFIPKNLGEKISGLSISDIKRRSKYILIELSDFHRNLDERAEFTLIIHLGMSGRLTVQQHDYQRKKHDHLLIELVLKSGVKKIMVLNDARRFGIVTLTKSSDLNFHKLFSKLGVEPLSKDFTCERLSKILEKREKNIKNTLMDSSLIVGIGNIYASEALFRSGINPIRQAQTLLDKEIYKLHQEIIKTLKDAIRAGGSTLKDFTKANGDSGYFQYQFKVYGREGKPCFICKTPISKIVQGGRSTFFCEKCQSLTEF